MAIETKPELEELELNHVGLTVEASVDCDGEVRADTVTAEVPLYLDKTESILLINHLIAVFELTEKEVYPWRN